jgi:catechol 2,3-dioxygenase-like lactoylglutathione lyase family enzyme
MLDKPIMLIACIDDTEALRFYRDVLGLNFVADTPFALVFDVGGTELRIQKTRDLEPAQHTVLGWQVVDIETAVNRLSKDGVSFATYEGMPQDERGIWTTPGGAKIAWFSDPDGNTLSLTQHP